MQQSEHDANIQQAPGVRVTSMTWNVRVSAELEKTHPTSAEHHLIPKKARELDFFFLVGDFLTFKYGCNLFILFKPNKIYGQSELSLLCQLVTSG